MKKESRPSSAARNAAGSSRSKPTNSTVPPNSRASASPFSLGPDTPFQQLRLTEPISYPKPSPDLVELPTMSSGQVILLACPFLIAYEEANCHP